jgi:uncharacterized phage protein (TIGR02220 family)
MRNKLLLMKWMRCLNFYAIRSKIPVAKRLTDSRKWFDGWFMNLEDKSKMTWVYLLDLCNHAGIYKLNPKLEELCLGYVLSYENLKEQFDGRILQFGDKLFLPGFIKFQYGTLNLSRKGSTVHKSVVFELETLKEGLSKGYLTTMDMDMDNSIIIDDKYILIIQAVLQHLNLKTSKNYKWQSRDNQLLVAARLKEGYTKEDLCKIIDNMCDKWLGDEKMEQYLRPITLFCRSKVEGYLNADKGLATEMKSWGKK